MATTIIATTTLATIILATTILATTTLATTTPFFNFLDKLNLYSTLILVIVTGYYARETHKMAVAIKKQIVSDIQISNIKLGNQFSDEWFKRELQRGAEPFLRFQLSFDITNKNVAAGSIKKPTLILKFKNENIEYKLNPSTKSQKEIGQKGPMTMYEIIDEGATIFLMGGASENYEFNYYFDLEKEKKEFTDKLKNPPDLLEYYLEYEDNLGEKKKEKIENIVLDGTEIFRK